MVMGATNTAENVVELAVTGQNRTPPTGKSASPFVPTENQGKKRFKRPSY
jgi:hypothetical protein